MVNSSIKKGGSPVTLINVFVVQPGKQDDVVRLLNDATEKVMRHLPGFVSAAVHKSLDGTRVTNYAQWRSRDDFLEMTKNPVVGAHIHSMSDYVQGFDPHLYEVCDIHVAEGAHAT